MRGVHEAPSSVVSKMPTPCTISPVARRVVRVREDRRHAEMPGRLVRGVVPALAARLALERREQRPGLAAVAALEHAGALRAGEEAAVVRGQAGDLRELELALAVAVRETLARLLPCLAEVGAAPDARAVPLARGGRVDRAAAGVVDGVVDRPALAERARAAASRAGPRRSRAGRPPCGCRRSGRSSPSSHLRLHACVQSSIPETGRARETHR